MTPLLRGFLWVLIMLQNKKNNIELQVTDDGSHTLFNPLINETYHNSKGAITEAQHVYINAGLEAILPFTTNIAILEVGFGTGLNAFQTLLRYQTLINNQKAANSTIYYQTLEPFPIDNSLISQLNYCQNDNYLNQQLFTKLHTSQWNKTHELIKGFCFNKFLGTLQNFNGQLNQFNVIYFDAFAPNKQPDIWNKGIFEKCYQLLMNNGLLVSYCANGQFKRDLKSVGFKVTVCPGALGKREMTQAWKQ